MQESDGLSPHENLYNYHRWHYHVPIFLGGLAVVQGMIDAGFEYAGYEAVNNGFIQGLSQAESYMVANGAAAAVSGVVIAVRNARLHSRLFRRYRSDNVQ